MVKGGPFTKPMTNDWLMHILYRFGSFGIVLVGLVKGPTENLVQRRVVYAIIPYTVGIVIFVD